VTNSRMNTENYKKSFFKKCLDRRVPQILGLYLGGSWAVLEFIGSFLVDRFYFPEYLVNLSIIILVTFIPSVITLAWFHGKPGPDKWTWVEKVVVPLNLIIILVILVFFIQGKDLKALTTSVSYRDEGGKKITLNVPRSEYRRSIALFKFDNKTGDPDYNWIGNAVVQLLDLDLDQDLFIQVISASQSIPFIRQKGFIEPVNIPLTLMLQAASEQYAEFFVSGRFTRTDSVYILDVDLYNTDQFKIIDHFSLQTESLPDGVDKLSYRIKEAVGIPAAHLARFQDVPVSELMTNDPEALRSFSTGMYELTVHNNYSSANSYLEKALKIDPSFAFASLNLLLLALDNNDAEKMSLLLPSLREHLYKLPERYRFHVNYIEFMLDGNFDRGEAILELWKKIFPADPVPGWYLAVNHYENSGQFRKAIKEYKSLLELQPYQGDYSLKIAELYYQEGLNKQAEAQYRMYIDNFPGDIKGYHKLGRFYLQTAEFEKAEKIYENAFLLKPENVETIINIAEIRIRQGLFEKARDDLNEALYLSRTLRDSINIFDKLIYLNEQRGRNKEALQLRRKTYDMAIKLDSPRQVLMERVTADIPLYIKTGDTLSAYENIEKLKQLPPPYNTFYVWGKLILARELKDPDKMIEAMKEGLQADLEKVYGHSYKIYREYSEALVFMLQERYNEAGEKFLALGMTGKAPVYGAECLRKTGYLRRARQVLEDYLKYYPADPEAHIQMAMIASNKENVDLYRYHLRVSLNVWKEADPDYQPRIELLKLLEEERF